MTADPRVFLAHILECAEKVRRYIASGEEAFQQDTMIQDAVIRNFEVIGEAVKRLPDEYRSQHPEIPWRLMAGVSRCIAADPSGPALTTALQDQLGLKIESAKGLVEVLVIDSVQKPTEN